MSQTETQEVPSENEELLYCVVMESPPLEIHQNCLETILCCVTVLEQADRSLPTLSILGSLWAPFGFAVSPQMGRCRQDVLRWILLCFCFCLKDFYLCRYLPHFNHLFSFLNCLPKSGITRAVEIPFHLEIPCELKLQFIFTEISSMVCKKDNSIVARP